MKPSGWKTIAEKAPVKESLIWIKRHNSDDPPIVVKVAPSRAYGFKAMKSSRSGSPKGFRLHPETLWHEFKAPALPEVEKEKETK